MGSPTDSPPTRIDRYELYDVIAAGGMATVHIGRFGGPAGFGKTVAIKRLHPHLAKEPEFASMLTDEARVAGRIGHPNIVPTLDVVASHDELFLVMEYVPGLTLAALMNQAAMAKEPVPLGVACAVMAGVLRGLDAAHEARDEHARPLEIVHRDVSPQNILVGVDGVARLLDFGIAKAAGRLHTTRDGQIKGKVGYMAPEQLGARGVDRRTDIYAASVVLWEAITGERLFDGEDAASVFGSVMQKKVLPPSSRRSGVPAALDAAVLAGLEREPSRRFARAREMAAAIEQATMLARTSEIAEWVAMLGSAELAARADLVIDIERRGAARRAPNADSSGIPTGLEGRTSLPFFKRRVTWMGIAVAVSIVGGAVVASKRPAQRAAPLPRDVDTVETGTIVTATEPAAPEPDRRSLARDSMSPNASSAATGPSAPRSHAASRPTASKPRANRTMACDPPFTIDEQGHKHYKVDCL
jgi:eukaryotic-like serine/threonine-protein kinase